MFKENYQKKPYKYHLLFLTRFNFDKTLIMSPYSNLSKVFVVIVIFSTCIASLFSFSYDPPKALTGSPGDGDDCRLCHNQEERFEPKKMISGVISTNIPASGYIPNEEYEITISGIGNPMYSRYGFSITSENQENEKAGEFIDGINSTTGFSGGKNHIGHGPASENNDPSWTFNWTAPEVGNGDITFYAVLVMKENPVIIASHVKFSELTILENIGVSVTKLNPETIDVFVNNSTLNLIAQKEIGIKKIHFVNQTGQLVFTKEINDALKKVSFDISQLPKGLYFANIESDEGFFTKKIIK